MNIILLALFGISLSLTATAQTVFDKKTGQFGLTLPLEDLQKDLLDEEYKVATINLPEKALPALIKRRTGNKDTYCRFPHLQLKADKSLAKGTDFENVRAAKMKTHCDPRDGVAMPTTNYGTTLELELEYFAREVWATLSPYAYRTAKVTIDYTSFDKTYSAREPALIYENDKDLKGRLGVRFIEEADDPYGNEEQSLAYFATLRQNFDQNTLALLYVFQAFLVNDSWHLAGLKDSTNFAKNVQVVAATSGRWYPVPWDFNRSLVVGEQMEAFLMTDLQSLMLDEAAGKLPARSLAAARSTFRSRAGEIRRLADSVSDEAARARLIDAINGFTGLL